MNGTTPPNNFFFFRGATFFNLVDEKKKTPTCNWSSRNFRPTRNSAQFIFRRILLLGKNTNAFVPRDLTCARSDATTSLSKQRRRRNNNSGSVIAPSSHITSISLFCLFTLTSRETALTSGKRSIKNNVLAVYVFRGVFFAGDPRKMP